MVHPKHIDTLMNFRMSLCRDIRISRLLTFDEFSWMNVILTVFVRELLKSDVLAALLVCDLLYWMKSLLYSGVHDGSYRF